jgi:hypothetical protein
MKKANLVPKNTTKPTLQTWTAFFYILVMVMASNISTLKSLGTLLSEKRHTLYVVFLAMQWTKVFGRFQYSLSIISPFSKQKKWIWGGGRSVKSFFPRIFLL